jgi:hypothetical protein
LIELFFRSRKSFRLRTTKSGSLPRVGKANFIRAKTVPEKKATSQPPKSVLRKILLVMRE